MGSYTSTITLLADVSDAIAKLKEVQAMIDAMNNTKIKVSVESDDLKDLTKTLGDVATALKDLGNDSNLKDIGGTSKGTKAMEDLNSAINSTQKSVKNLASDSKGTKELEKQMDNLAAAGKAVNNVFSEQGTTKTKNNDTPSKNIDKETKNIQKSATTAARAVRGINKMIKEDEFAKNLKAMETYENEYAGQQSKAYRDAIADQKNYAKYANEAKKITNNGTKEIAENSKEAKELIKIYDEANASQRKWKNDSAISKQEAKDTGFKTLTEQAKEASKATEQADAQVRKSVQSMMDAVSNDKYKNTISGYNQAMDSYKNFDSSSIRDEAQAINELNSSYSDFVGTVGKVTSNSSLEDVMNSLFNAGYNKDAINEWAKQMTQTLPKTITDGMKTVKDEYSDLAKAQTDFEKGLTNGTYLRDIDNIGKNLGDNKNLDGIKEVNDALEQQSKYYDLVANARENMQKNGGSFNAQQFMKENNLTAEQFENLPKDFKNSATAAKELNTELKQMGINASDVAKVTSGEMQKSINDLENNISKMPDSYTKSNLNGMVQDMERLYGQAQAAIGEGTASGYAQATKDAEEFDQTAQRANQTFQEFMKLGSGTSSGGSGTGGGGGNIFMGGLTSGSGGSGVSGWFTGLKTDLQSTFNDVAPYVNRFLGYNAIYREARQAAQEMVQTVEEVDTSMNQLQIVTGASDSEMSKFFESSVSQAKELGQSVTDVLDTIQVYSRLGYNLEDASELTEYTSILANVAAVDIEDATSGLTSVIKGLKISSFFFNCWEPLRVLHATT